MQDETSEVFHIRQDAETYKEIAGAFFMTNNDLCDLIRDMWTGMCGYEHDCRYCEHYEPHASKLGDCEFARRIDELGIEVSE